MPRRRISALRLEASYVCGTCGEEIVVTIDASAGAQQSYVEDCPVCCRPHAVYLEIDPEGDSRLWAQPE
jgi:DNA-directed RNA polymerase subunit RPC12/RpoP